MANSSTALWTVAVAAIAGLFLNAKFLFGIHRWLTLAVTVLTCLITLGVAALPMTYHCCDPANDPESRWSQHIVGGVTVPIDTDQERVFVQFVELEQGRMLTEVLVARLVF